MKKKLCAFTALALALSLLSVPSLAVTTTNSENNAADILAKHEITVIKETGSAMIADAQVELSHPFDSTSDGNYLFEGNTFDSVLSQAAEIKSMIKRGNLIAIYNEDGIEKDYEETLELPLGYENGAADENSMVTVGKIYCTDANGYLRIAQYNVQAENISETTYDNFLNYVDSFITKTSAVQATTVASATALSMEFLGTVDNAFEGDDEMGDLYVTYDVSTAQAVSEKDYYGIHAYIDATPGHAISSNGYLVQEFTTSLSSPSTGARLYKTGPNTTITANDYTVNLGFTGSQSGNSGTFNFGWSGELPGMDISKVVNGSASCSWTVSISNTTTASDSTISFEPGGLFYVEEGYNRLTIESDHSLTVDTIKTNPEEALSASWTFYCDADDVW